MEPFLKEAVGKEGTKWIAIRKRIVDTVSVPS
jgi:hypothetical protein